MEPNDCKQSPPFKPHLSHPHADVQNAFLCRALILTLMSGRWTHLGLWSNACCDRPFGTEIVSAKSLPRHSDLLKQGLFLNQRKGKARDDNNVFFSLK